METGLTTTCVETSQRNHTRAILNVRLRAASVPLVLVGLGVQIGVACKSADDTEIWISPESFVFVSVLLIVTLRNSGY